MKHVATTLIAALTLYTTSPVSMAAATESDGVLTETVRFSDLDLTRPAGAQELYSRIRHAARDVCDTDASGGAAAAIRIRICTDKAVARAVADVGSPLLTERFERHTHQGILQVQQAGLNR